MSVSVIIPTHNRAHTLARALDSVLAQRLPATEIIVVDDGSDDDSQGLLQRHYPQVTVLSQPNAGVSAARNRGIAAARGEWLALLDSDDAWLPDKLERQLALLQQQPGSRLCHGEEIWIRNGVRVNAMNKHAKAGGRIFERCLPLCVISPSASVIHRSVFEDIGEFDETLPACEDYDFWLRLCAGEAVSFVEQPVIQKFGGHDDQLSRRFWGMDRFRIRALEKLLQDRRVTLDASQQLAVKTMIVKKATIFAQGAAKRGNLGTEAEYRELIRRYQEPDLV